MKEDSSDTMPLENDDTSDAPSSNPRHNNHESNHNYEASKRVTNQMDFVPPPWLFKHKNLNETLDLTKRVEESFLRNKLNYIHFMDRKLLVLLRHPRYEELLTVTAKPGPCTGGEVTCELLVDRASLPYLKRYAFLHLIINDGQSVILIPITLTKIYENEFSFRLPKEGYSVGQRQVRRYSCQRIHVELIQRGLTIKGELLDYSSKGFCVRIGHVPRGIFDWSPGSELLTLVHLRRDQQNLFSGLCQCLRQQDDVSFTDIVLAPARNPSRHHDREQVRRVAKDIPLSPVISFVHPFIGKKTHLDVFDISTSGFSVCEKANEDVLIEGMIISDLTIEFAGSLKMDCSAQVVGRYEEDEGTIRSDFVILDMAINAYSQLCHILANTKDSHAYISREVDMDALWEFFFEAGFIYPRKYGILQHNRESFKETWSKLYREDIEISKYVTYQKNGRIYGHISMLRAYEKTWMIHHHASRKLRGGIAGIIVLRQLMEYLNDMHGLPSANMDYVMSHFRPQNKFPNIVFGDFARGLGDPSACSMDLFTYFPFKRGECETKLPKRWSVDPCSPFDLWELNRFYSSHSGGLLIDAMGLCSASSTAGELEKVYASLGLSRSWTAYALKYKEELIAVLIVDRSDIGFNLSELLNAIKVIVVSSDYLDWAILSTAIQKLIHGFEADVIPILCYPFEYIESMGIPYEGQYYAWTLSVRYGRQFMKYVNDKFKRY